MQQHTNIIHVSNKFCLLGNYVSRHLCENKIIVIGKPASSKIEFVQHYNHLFYIIKTIDVKLFNENASYRFTVLEINYKN